MTGDSLHTKRWGGGRIELMKKFNSVHHCIKNIRKSYANSENDMIQSKIDNFSYETVFHKIFNLNYSDYNDSIYTDLWATVSLNLPVKWQTNESQNWRTANSSLRHLWLKSVILLLCNVSMTRYKGVSFSLILLMPYEENMLTLSCKDRPVHQRSIHNHTCISTYGTLELPFTI